VRFPGIGGIIRGLLPDRYKPYAEPMLWGFIGGLVAGALLVAIPALVITGQRVGNGVVGSVAIAGGCLGGVAGAWLAAGWVARRHRCFHCRGTGVIVANRTLVKCPDCLGLGKS
jgi:hypothetical protein